MNGQDRDGSDGGDHGGEHDDDEPGGAVCGLWRGLGDSHGVDESVRYEQDELHGFSMLTSKRMVAGIVAGMCFSMAESEGWDAASIE